jgi:hypothetical protein
MKAFALFVKYVVIPGTTVVGCFYGFDTYVFNRGKTAVEPVRVRVEILEAHGRIDQERIERELYMIRSMQEETNKYLRAKK